MRAWDCVEPSRGSCVSNNDPWSEADHGKGTKSVYRLYLAIRCSPGALLAAAASRLRDRRSPGT